MSEAEVGVEYADLPEEERLLILRFIRAHADLLDKAPETAAQIICGAFRELADEIEASCHLLMADEGGVRPRVRP